MLKREHVIEQFPDKASSVDKWKLFCERITDERNHPKHYRTKFGKGWRNCIFTGNCLHVEESGLAKARFVRRREPAPDDERGRHWFGPAATFRIYRKIEWDAMHKQAQEAKA